MLAKSAAVPAAPAPAAARVTLRPDSRAIARRGEAA